MARWVNATFDGQTYLFAINYSGGDGNDITLAFVTQGITFPEIPNKQTTDAPFTLGATASSGLPVNYTVVAGNASASITGSTVTLTGTAGVVTDQSHTAGKWQHHRGCTTGHADVRRHLRRGLHADQQQQDEQRRVHSGHPHGRHSLGMGK